ncbi:MAG: hypothetical protein JRJ65_07850 [Deltaproteobacteria bacterium]|nr:hypothetical protein [Deltaproteobacteria bacterium]
MDNDNGLNELKALLLLNCYLMLAGDEFPARQDENAIWEAVAKNYDKIRLWLGTNGTLSGSSNPGELDPVLH